MTGSRNNDRSASTVADSPDLLRQWHRTKNDDLQPESLSSGSGRRVWWKCEVAPDHEWAALVSSRTRGVGCPFCANKAVAPSNSLATLAPAVSKQWHPTRNPGLTPHDLTPGSNRKVWWLCAAGPDHEWQTAVFRRTSGQNCPFCSGRRRPGEPPRTPRKGTLASFPSLVREWHATKNGALTPRDLSPGSGHRAWWSCSRGADHEWQAPVNNRTKGAGCPFCSNRRVSPSNSLAHLAPSLAKQWHPRRNGKLTPADVTPGSSKKVWWLCRAKPAHEWKAIVQYRSSRTADCPFCKGRKVAPGNSLADEHPEIARQWHPTKNGKLKANHVRPGSSKVVWWRCPVEGRHDWQAPVYSRLAERDDGELSGCPFCAGNRLSPERSLGAVNPDVAAEWHPTKNKGLTPFDVAPSSGLTVWWRCASGPDHEWRACPNQRVASDGTAKSGCAFCSSKRLSVTNSLATRFPRIAAQWHPTRNGVLTPNKVIAGSNVRVWWKCDKGPDHEWEGAVGNRTDSTRKPTGCPFCANLRVSVTNALSAHSPKIARQWHPTLNDSLGPHQVVYGSERKVWWRCVAGHDWRTKVTDRVKKGAGCPHCRLRKHRPAVTFKRPRIRVRLPSDSS